MGRTSPRKPQPQIEDVPLRSQNLSLCLGSPYVKYDSWDFFEFELRSEVYACDIISVVRTGVFHSHLNAYQTRGGICQCPKYQGETVAL